MTVFKGFMIMVKRNIGMMILYLSIFITLCVSVQAMTGGKGMEHFEEESLNIAIIDRDQGALAEGLTKYLAERHHLIDVKDDQTSIQEKLFYRDIYYVLTIPKDFENGYLENGEKLKTTKLPGTTSAFYVDQQIDTFLNDVKILSGAGYRMDEAIEKVLDAGDTETKVTLIDKNGHGGTAAPHAFMFQYMPYILMSILCYIVSFVIIAFRKKDIRRRILCSAVSSRKQNMQLVLGYFVIGIGVWLICILLPVIMYGKEFLLDTNLGLYLLNSFMVMLVSLAISFLLGVIIENEVAINAVVNVISLGMSFICGVFVSLEVLGKGVRLIAQFLPVYWYEVVNGILINNVEFSKAQQTEIFKGIGIQLLFAAAILSLGLIVSKCKEQE